MTEHIGKRIRTWRRRRGGMSQKTLADLSGVSQAYISQIETGARPLDRKSTQAAIASALNISVAQLLGVHGEDDPMRQRAMAHVPDIEAAIVELSYGERRVAERDQDAIRNAVHNATELRNAANYAALAPMLSPLLLDIGAYGEDLAPELIDSLGTTQTVLENLGEKILAREAAQLSVRIAERYDDAAWLGQARYCLAWALPPQNAATGIRLTNCTADELQTVADHRALDVYGRLHLFAALQSAVALKADDAATHLNEAATVARSLGEPQRESLLSAGFTGSWFGPTNVDLWRMAVAAELADTATTLSVAKHIDLDAVPVPNRHVYFHIDLARALAVDGKRDREAMHTLANAERAAPQHFRFHPVARNLVTSLIYRAKKQAIGPEMEALARRLGIEPYNSLR
jgi:transcriptional regulator with XRE-family HTH domain